MTLIDFADIRSHSLTLPLSLLPNLSRLSLVSPLIQPFKLLLILDNVMYNERQASLNTLSELKPSCRVYICVNLIKLFYLVFIHLICYSHKRNLFASPPSTRFEKHVLISARVLSSLKSRGRFRGDDAKTLLHLTLFEALTFRNVTYSIVNNNYISPPFSPSASRTWTFSVFLPVFRAVYNCFIRRFLPQILPPVLATHHTTLRRLQPPISFTHPAASPRKQPLAPQSAR